MSKRQNPYAGQDPATREAKARGYPARSVFKLQEIDQRTQLFRPGLHVLDLGAAPGSWSLYASQKVGARGRVLAIDLQPIEQRFEPNVVTVQGDAFDLDNEQLGRFAPYDIVLSDMAPRTSGVKFQDQSASLELFLRALAVAAALGKDRSHFVGKLFMGPDFDAAVQATKRHYSKTRVIRPAGTRAVSKEIFLVGLGLRRPEAPPSTESA
jgi:23S rRNA (uridine2552-2'-O)-methyltransferase